MGSTDKYYLGWNDYRSNISLAFKDLRSVESNEILLVATLVKILLKYANIYSARRLIESLWVIIKVITITE